MDIKVYSAITGDKDDPRDDKVQTFGEYNKFKSPVMNAKIYKVLPHLFFDNEYSIWVDGNLELRKTPEEMVKMMGDKDISVFPNPYRTDPIDEAEYCLAMGIGDKMGILSQLERYEDKKPLCKLSACGMIIRRHTKEMNILCEKWWAEICRGSVRDQISFPFVFPDEKISWLPFQSNFKDNEYFKRKGHNQ